MSYEDEYYDECPKCSHTIDDLDIKINSLSEELEKSDWYISELEHRLGVIKAGETLIVGNANNLGKDKIGKPEGARYFLFDNLAEIVNEPHLSRILNSFNNLVYSEYTINSIQNVISAIQFLENFVEILDEAIEVRYYAISSGKYSKLSYKNLTCKEDIADAAARHLIKHSLGFDRDLESGKLHMSHFLVNLILLAGVISDE